MIYKHPAPHELALRQWQLRLSELRRNLHIRGFEAVDLVDFAKTSQLFALLEKLPARNHVDSKSSNNTDPARLSASALTFVLGGTVYHAGAYRTASRMKSHSVVIQHHS